MYACSLAVAGFSREQLGKVVARNRPVLTFSLEGTVQPLLAALEVACGGSRAAVVKAVCTAPMLLGMALGTVGGNVAAMRRLGLSDADIAQSVAKCPQLFACDYTIEEEFGAKLRYFEEVFGKPPWDMLQHPAYLKSGLRGIDRKVGAKCLFSVLLLLGSACLLSGKEEVDAEGRG